MMQAKRSFLWVLFFYTRLLVVTGQEFGYTRYDSKDGLAGSTVYCMTQDKDGFLWFGTESGLSRFDGTHFKNFKKEDGLPNNEVIQIYADSKGRVWAAPFKKAICYYYKGKIYNQDNDPVLKSIHITDHIVHMAEDAQGNILLQEIGKLHLIQPIGSVITIDKIDNRPFSYINSVGKSAQGGFGVVEHNRLYNFQNNRFRLLDTLPIYGPHFMYFSINEKAMIWRSSAGQISARSFVTSGTIKFGSIGEEFTNLCVVDENQVGLCTTKGAYIYNINNHDSVQYLPGLHVSNIFRDSEGNTWFSTLGKGIYRLNSPYIKNLTLDINQNNHQVLSLGRYKNTILVGQDMNELCLLNKETSKPERIINNSKTIKTVPVHSLFINDRNTVFYGTSIGLFKLGPNFIAQNKIRCTVKAICAWKNKLVISTDKNVLLVNPDRLIVTDTIWHERATTAFAAGDTIFIGTLAGMYCWYPNKNVEYWGDKNPVFRNRITAIARDSNDVLWIATYDEGVIGWKNEQVVARINQYNGLTSNTCRTIFLNKQSLWVGTDQGLNRINVGTGDYRVKKFTTGDGLISNVINALYVEDNKVFVGTTEGVTFFDEQKINNESYCHLWFTNITISGQSYYPHEMPVELPHKKNNIRFDFVGISYKSAGDIRYRYRLLGLDATWKETRETFLSYPTLPSGDYELQLQAINKFDVNSKLIASKFSIQKLLWEETWFQLLTGLMFLTITTVLVLLIIRRIRNREREKSIISKRIGDLEQLARKAQMNPHFIFNSLNSIQQYVMDADIVGANKFISGFSRLIRQTLDFSSKPEISIAEELDYLTNYLELEKTRLEDAFSWSVSVAPDLNTAEYLIPPMILQPFVENSVRHGLRYRKDKEGKVTVVIRKEEGYLICVLEDNGVGRKTALKYKSANPIEYQSKGMSLTAERITMFNKDNPHKITMQIDDLEDDHQNSLGTRVTLYFPVL